MNALVRSMNTAHRSMHCSMRFSWTCCNGAATRTEAPLGFRQVALINVVDVPAEEDAGEELSSN